MSRFLVPSGLIVERLLQLLYGDARQVTLHETLPELDERFYDRGFVGSISGGSRWRAQ